MHKSLLIGLSVSAFMLANNAQAFEYGHPISATIETNNSVSTFANGIQSSASTSKKVYLMNIKMSADEKKKFFDYKSTADSTSNFKLAATAATLPTKYDAGMNNVPVLDQGAHGSCVTFANTAAVDALLGKGDYVSQLCSLELGSYLEKRSYLPSGWEGSAGGLVLSQLLGYGIVSTSTQKTKSCAGVTAYPLADENNTGNPIALDDYKQISESLGDNMYWDQMLTLPQRLQWSSTPQDDGATILTQVKQALAVKRPTDVDSRLTFAVILPVSHCSAGACAKYHANQDTWAYTKAIKNDPNGETGGHEMVITGYDDNAVATDNEGAKHKGLLILRNSWGTSAGDKGTYYMTYEFFKQFVMEVQRVGLMKDQSN